MTLHAALLAGRYAVQMTTYYAIVVRVVGVSYQCLVFWGMFAGLPCGQLVVDSPVQVSSALVRIGVQVDHHGWYAVGVKAAASA
jgi:hypothetical protein